MNIPFLELKRHHQDIQNELNAVTQKVVEEGWYVGGPRVKQFEEEFAAYLGARHCISCGNGTDALELVLEAMEIGPGDEVIIPSFTWVSNAEVVIRVGAKPVFADLPAHGYNISAEMIEPLININTKVIMAVHLYGVPCDMPAIMHLAKKHDIKVIEDCAQAHGAHIEGQKVGTFGNASAFSFYPTKNLGALGDGGAVVTNDNTLSDKIRLLADHGQQVRDKHLTVGRNSRLDTLQAAVLSLKLKHLDQWNAERAQLANQYLEGLKDCDLILPTSNESRVFHLFTIMSSRRDALKEHLSEKGIATAIHYPKAIHQIEAYHSNEHLPSAEKAASQILSIPLFPGLRKEEVSRLVEEVRRFL
ncbi:DegT/DnrJ/EryC1/StrS family aminotransferase [Fulvivirga sp. RKSG066]|uniref:DegT/DnrJ/EryC1/StrS family aminotransferase n=1 Tax=Fulvivirga aurantia TaxID=2529383 RepID=UPI0012BCDA3E|nr:DegT/DnrJ/EryC1/StrS family aminotransferase [Fulvivirga aurantia]MTI22752.1 DegT/DnrJ/EryC1/StrS family aminotransferase [Fulvivirga aurantia]